MASEHPKYDEQLDHLLDHVIHRITQITKADGPNLYYTNLLRNANNVSLILTTQKNAKRFRDRSKSPMDWKTANN
jgi:hypothetical protein